MILRYIFIICFVRVKNDKLGLFYFSSLFPFSFLSYFPILDLELQVSMMLHMKVTVTQLYIM